MASKKTNKRSVSSKSKNPGNIVINIAKDGPYLVSGRLPMVKEIITSDKDGHPDRYVKGEKYPAKESCGLCRCGNSGNKPYCDGAHSKSGFDGTETASMEKYSKMKKVINGPKLILHDVEELCSIARFCHTKKGGVWSLTMGSDDPAKRKIALKGICNCPSGRLVAVDKKTKKAIEPKFKPSISLIEDPDNGVSGPIWLKGCVQVISCDGKKYEARNRVTLCRCGQSQNKPFCDGSHIEAGFSDGDRTLGAKKRR